LKLIFLKFLVLTHTLPRQNITNSDTTVLRANCYQRRSR